MIAMTFSSLSSLLLLVYLPHVAADSTPTPFRPPTIPLIQVDSYQQVHMMGDTLTSDQPRFWDKREKDMAGFISIPNEGVFRWLGACSFFHASSCPEALVQDSVTVNPTQTIVKMHSPGGTTVTVTFTETVHDANDLLLLSRPVSYIDVTASTPSTYYLDLSSQHTVNSPSEEVTWEVYESGALVGTTEQPVLGRDGDKMNINWGYLHLSAAGEGSNFYAGNIDNSRKSFMAKTVLPTEIDAPPRKSDDGSPGIAALADSSSSATFLVAYDDVASVDYFGNSMTALWKNTYEDIHAAIAAAVDDHEDIMSKASVFDSDLMQTLSEKGGAKYAQIAAVAYRQTWAATKLVHNSALDKPWCFMKEISTNGDMSTMDVIFPASPFFLYHNPEVLRMLLEPVLAYAANETNVNYSSPYSPHQLGVYPLAKSTTQEQEQMPVENTGNMFLLLKALSKRGENDWFSSRINMLATWADNMVLALPFPESQLSTDDFMGKYANNTNLAAKGMIGLYAFGEVCEDLAMEGCEGYKSVAMELAGTWSDKSYATSPTPHHVMAFNAPDRTYSLKYNLIWQKILKMDGPFKDWDDIAEREAAFYETKMLRYGVPLESKLDGTRAIFRTMVKLDWLSWCACFTESSFRTLFDPIYDMANESLSRVVLTDLYDTITGVSFSGIIDAFVARPVVGAVYAKMLMD
jgi:hypothetical protein